MKRIDELGINPMPWVYSKDIGAILSDAHGVVYDEQMLANDARLIAAAPELYEALRKLISVAWNRLPSQPTLDEIEVLQMSESALAKASGEEAK